MNFTATLVAALLSSPALAQSSELQSWDDLTREAVIARISETLAEVNAPFARAAYSNTAASEGMLEGIIQAGIREVLALRDGLASNPYVRVSSFSVGFPAGVSVEFTFPPTD